LKKPKRKGKEETADSFPIVAIEVEHEMTFNHSQNKDDKKRNTKKKRVSLKIPRNICQRV